MERRGYFYILTNKQNAVLYVGVSSNLAHRLYAHKNKVHPKSFTAKCECNKLVYFKGFKNIEEATATEKQIKGGSRLKKINLIISKKPNWNDLSNLVID